MDVIRGNIGKKSKFTRENLARIRTYELLSCQPNVEATQLLLLQRKVITHTIQKTRTYTLPAM